MSKNTWIKLLFFASWILAGCFGLFLGYDLHGYILAGGAWSAPFYTFVLVRAMMFLFPALVCFLAALTLTKK